MNTRTHLLTPLICTLLFVLQGCSQTSQPLGLPAPGKTSSSAEMERQIDIPGPIQLESINSADWSVPLSGLLNLKSPAAIQAGLKDRDEPIQVYAHLLHHPQRGSYLVDTGVSQKLLDDPQKEGLSWLLLKVMPIKKMQIRKSTGDILRGINGKLSGVFFTHLHLDHISGIPDIPNEVPLYIGATESTSKYVLSIFTQGSADQLFKNKHPLQEWNFQPDPQHKFEGIVDIFEDGTVFAISVPGHTPGSVAYFIRTTQGPVLLTGDTSHTRWGWENTVEPGDYTQDNARNLANLKKLKDLVASHPKIEVRFGHQR